MSQAEEVDINEIFLKAHKLSVKMAIETAARTGTSLVIYENGKVKWVRPKFKYVRVPIASTKSKNSPKTKSSSKKP